MELNSNHVSCKFAHEVKHATSEVLVLLKHQQGWLFVHWNFISKRRKPRGFSEVQAQQASTKVGYHSSFSGCEK